MFSVFWVMVIFCESMVLLLLVSMFDWVLDLMFMFLL